MKLTQTQRLYGVDVNPAIWGKMPYTKALLYKIKLADERIKHLNTAHYMDKDSQNINECVAAMRFNEKLLKEAKC